MDTSDAPNKIIQLKSSLRNNTLISDDYIEFNTSSVGHFTIGTTEGNPNSITDNNKKMLYGHPNGSTSLTTININGTPSIFNATNVTYDPENSKSIATATTSDIDVTQEITIIENAATGRNDVVKIKYILHNQSSAVQQVGIRIMLDTMLGNNDAAPFKINGRDITTETEYIGNAIPQIWQAFDSITNPGVVSQGTFFKSGDIKPDKVQFTNWRAVHNNIWDYKITPNRSNGDSAVSVTWNPISMCSGETKEYVTYYGLSELDQNLLPPIALGVYADNQLDYSGGQYGNVNLSIYMDNISAVDVSNISLDVSTPQYLELTTPITFPTNYSLMKSGTQNALALSYKLKDSQKVNQDLEDTITVKLTYPMDNGKQEVKVITKKIIIPKIKKAIVIVPGIMGSRLFRENGDRCWEPFWINADMNIDWDDNYIINGIMAANMVSDLAHISCDSKGNSDDVIKLNTQIYGALDTYEELYKKLQAAQFNEITNVLFYPYDWRLDIDTQLSALYDKIKDYDDVNIVAHSMGGLLVNAFVDDYAPDNVSKIVTLGTPFGGSPLAGKILLSGDASDVLGNEAIAYASPIIQSLTKNFTSIYELLPDEEYTNKYMWLNKRNVKYTGKWWEIWKTESYDTPLDFDETNDIISNHCNDDLLDKALDFQANRETTNYNNIETIAFIGDYADSTLTSLSYANTSQGFFVIPSYSNSIGRGDSIVPVNSAKQRFKYYKQYSQSHMGLVVDHTVIEDVIAFIKGGRNALSNVNTRTLPTQKLFAAVAADVSAPTYQFAFKGNMNMVATGNNSTYHLVLNKDNDSNWFGIYDRSNDFIIDRMGNLENQEMYICTYTDNTFAYSMKSLENQNVDLVFSTDTTSFIASQIPVAKNDIIQVDVINRKVTVNDKIYKFVDINASKLTSDDIALTTKNIYNNNISDTIATRIKLKNLSEKDIDINNLEIVYLYQNDGNENEVFECDWAGQDNKYITNSVNGTISYDESLGCSKISVKFTKEDNCMLTPDTILDVHFRVHTINWDKYDLSNDFSFHPELEYTENSKMLIYYNGELVNDSAT